jgi:CheY-like chemotaxis protein
MLLVDMLGLTHEIYDRLHRRISIASIRAYQASRGVKTPPLATGDSVLRMVVVDDDASHREMLDDLVSRWQLPIDCTFMASALEALIDIHSLRPDVLMTDLNMPGVDGDELLRMLRSKPAFENLIMVAITGPSAQDAAEQTGLPEHTIVQSKPVDATWLKGFITALATAKAISSLAVKKQTR